MRNLFQALGAHPESTFAESPDTIPLQLKPPGTSAKIMLVDDEKDFMDLVECLLRRHFTNVRVLKFQDGEQAWQELVWQEPDLLISDLMRAGVDGVELLRRLAQRRVKFPVVILSGNVPQGNQAIRRCAGPDLRLTLLSKPFDAINLLTVVERLLGIKAETAVSQPPASASTPRPLRIVHVDDEPAVLEMMSVLVRGRFENLELLQFQNSATAMGVLMRFDPDLLITDDRMPWLSGCDIVERLARRKAAFPIVVTSAWDQTQQWVSDFARSGLRISFFPVPFDLDTFFSHVSRQLGNL
jgi:DNA-binding NtrC family response regulator